jgi:hypothetical protein
MMAVFVRKTEETKFKAPFELRLNVAMFWVSLANTKWALAARSVCGELPVKAAVEKGLPGTRWAEPFACRLNARIGCGALSLSPRYTNAIVGDVVVCAKLAVTQVTSNVARNESCSYNTLFAEWRSGRFVKDSERVPNWAI